MTTAQDLAIYQRSRQVLSPITDTVLMQATAYAMTQGIELLEAFQLGETTEDHVDQLLTGITLPANALVVDIGCGIGTVLRIIQAWRPDVQGVNINRSPLQLTACGGVVADGSALPVRTGCADVVLCSYALGYGLLEPWLAEAARITKPGGQLCIFDLWSDQPEAFLEQTGYISHLPQRVLDAGTSAGWSLTAEYVLARPSPVFLRLMGIDAFRTLFGSCHSMRYSGLRQEVA